MSATRSLHGLVRFSRFPVNSYSSEFTGPVSEQIGDGSRSRPSPAKQD